MRILDVNLDDVDGDILYTEVDPKDKTIKLGRQVVLRATSYKGMRSFFSVLGTIIEILPDGSTTCRVDWNTLSLGTKPRP